MLNKASDHSLLAVKIQENRQQSSAIKQDMVVVEEPLEIWVRYSESGHAFSSPAIISTTMRTPGDDLNLVRGWLYTLADVGSNDVLDIKHTGSQVLKTGQSNRVLVTLKKQAMSRLEQLERNEVVTSSCGVCGFKKIDELLSVADTYKVKPAFYLETSQIFDLTQRLTQHQPLFAVTGGNHGAGLFNANAQLLDVREDVGRHNAMDKLIGANLEMITNQVTEKPAMPLGVILSGRASFELVLKAVKANLSMIIAVGAPSSLAINLAKEADITLFGFVGAQKVNCYTPVGQNHE